MNELRCHCAWQSVERNLTGPVVAADGATATFPLGLNGLRLPTRPRSPSAVQEPLRRRLRAVRDLILRSATPPVAQARRQAMGASTTPTAAAAALHSALRN